MVNSQQVCFMHFVHKGQNSERKNPANGTKLNGKTAVVILQPKIILSFTGVAWDLAGYTGIVEDVAMVLFKSAIYVVNVSAVAKFTDSLYLRNRVTYFCIKKELL